MIYVRLWWRFVAMAAMRGAAYRLGFALAVGEGALQALVAAVAVTAIYQFTGGVAGWGRAEALMVLGMYRAAEGLLRFQVAQNLWSVPGIVRRGEMDSLLLRPVSSRFLASAQVVDLPELVNALVGVGIVVYAGRAAGVAWGPAEVGAALLLAACGVAALYALWLACVTLSFWSVDTGPLSGVLETLRGAGAYPAALFPRPARLFLTAAFPVAFATTFPAEALRGGADARLLAAGLGLALLALWGSGRLWEIGVRRYSSAQGR